MQLESSFFLLKIIKQMIISSKYFYHFCAFSLNVMIPAVGTLKLYHTETSHDTPHRRQSISKVEKKTTLAITKLCK